MNHTIQNAAADTTRQTRRKWWVVGVGTAVCLLTWAALGVGLAFGVEVGPRLALATMAAVATEGLVWVIAGVFGLSVLQARRRIWRSLRDAPRRLRAPR